jgi:hypothetical protein
LGPFTITSGIDGIGLAVAGSCGHRNLGDFGGNGQFGLHPASLTPRPSGNDPADLEDSPNRSSGGHDAQGNQAEHQRHVSKPAGGFWVGGAIEHFDLVDR